LELVSQRDVKTLRREVLSVKPGTPKAAPHQRWKNSTISFGPSDCPENMAGAGVLQLVTAPTIANVRLHHVLIDGGADLSVISYAALKHLQIPESKLAPSRPFSGVGPNPVYPVETISLPATFGMEDNFRTENVEFEVAKVNLPFTAIIGRPALYREKVQKLLQAGFIAEVYHPVWLANPVMVPKANRKLRMCIDYTNLNKACPKDSYTLLRIDQIVDSTSGCDLLSFIDAYSGFHQIKIATDDRKHTAFVTVDGLYCYIVMSYGLLNTLPTFARAMNITLGDLVRDIVEVYIDDIVVKTSESNSLLENLAQVFDKLRATSTKLNPEKCVFGVSAGKLVSFLVSHREIEANPDKVRAIEAMRPPARLKDGLRLTGSLVALSRFISRLAERALPFFELMRGSGPFAWTEEAERAFQEMKQYLTSLPVLVAPDPGETLFLYLAATAEVISMVLVTERSEHLPQGAPVDPL
jgi:hypothetical protein